MATQPCPCGFYTHPEKACVCRSEHITRYHSRISGPLLDRIDLHIEVNAVNFKELQDRRKGETSETIRERVEEARHTQRHRFPDPRTLVNPNILSKTHCNAQMSPGEIREFCQMNADGARLMEHAMNRLGLTARAYDRILKVSRTIADLAESPTIESHHIAEAIQYRALDRYHWTPNSAN